jgi:hypothetical protein
MLPHQNINKYMWTSPDGKIHNETGVLIDKRWHSSTLDTLLSFLGKLTIILTIIWWMQKLGRNCLWVNKQQKKKIDMERFNPKLTK